MLQAVAHEVKNLLAELALRMQSQDPHAAALAHKAADKLAQALLLDNPHQLVPQIDAASPAELLEELAAEYRPLFTDKTLIIETRSAPTLWYYDVHLLRLALGNLVHNALKHCRNSVTLSARQMDETLILEVRDDGSGFSPAQLTGEPFKFSRHSQSTGLGLLLARQIAAAHSHNKKSIRLGALNIGNDNGGVVTIALP